MPVTPPPAQPGDTPEERADAGGDAVVGAPEPGGPASPTPGDDVVPPPADWQGDAEPRGDAVVPDPGEQITS